MSGTDLLAVLLESKSAPLPNRIYKPKKLVDLTVGKKMSIGCNSAFGKSKYCVGRSLGFGAVRSSGLALVLLLLSVASRAQTLDFEGIGTITGPPFDVVTMGFKVQAFLTQGAPEPIIRPANLSPNGTDMYAICGFCADSGGFNLFATDGSAFSLVSIDLGGFGNTADEFDFTLTGYTLTGGIVTEMLTLTVVEGVQTLVLGAGWNNLTSVTVSVDNAGNAGFSGSVYDNIELADPPLAVSIDVLPGSSANNVYPNKTGKLPVAVLSSAEFDATQVNPATLKFGSSEASPSDPAVIADIDGVFGNDTSVRFRVEETGIFCDDTEVTLVGETYAGEAFAGADSIDASDCETGGCHPY